MVPALGVADGGVQRAERDLRERTAARVEGAATAISRAKRASVLAELLGLAVAAFIAIRLTRYISRPVEELERGMGAVADGDFEVKLPLASNRADEFGQLASSFERMTAQLAELDKLKAEFVSIASHELKTPINVVLGYLQLLEEGVYGPLSPEQKDIHETLESQVQALGRLVQQLLDISRFEAGGSKLEPRPFKLAPFLDEMEQGFQVLARQRGIRFIVTRREAVPEEVVWDRDRMSEVLGNLLSNAFKFTGRGGEVELSVDSADDRVQMEVRDTGAGIAQDQLPHVFEKFYQADNQRSASAKGTGLGLAIAKNIVEAHRGSIHCESTAGVGTTFTITLPARVTGRRSSAQRMEAAGVA
jgi:signal transduction histidine kinase